MSKKVKVKTKSPKFPTLSFCIGDVEVLVKQGKIQHKIVGELHHTEPSPQDEGEENPAWEED